MPAGGLFTGAEAIKTEDQAVLFGGTAGVPYDSCYHQACDTTRNLNNTVFLENAKAIAHATAIFASDTSAVNGRAVTARAHLAAAPPADALSQDPHGRVGR